MIHSDTFYRTNPDGTVFVTFDSAVQVTVPPTNDTPKQGIIFVREEDGTAISYLASFRGTSGDQVVTSLNTFSPLGTGLVSIGVNARDVNPSASVIVSDLTNTLSVRIIDVAGTSAFVRNAGNAKRLDNSGTASPSFNGVSQSLTKVTVNHGLGVVPNSITLTADTGQTLCWYESANATSFVIAGYNVVGVPVAGNINVSWRAVG